MSDQRPDPDRLLAQVQREEAAARRGRLKIFFGANAGVGKTFAMLAAAHAAQQQGRALRVGVVETHGRGDTEAMARDLGRLPLREIPHKGQILREFDLDGALAWAAGQPGGVLLLDELAHSNAPGSRHAKRWQDAEELREAGVEVWTTLNVQHLESLNDVVGGITGIRVWETVPDRVFDEADEVVVVDLPPDELLQRLKEGKVYLPQQAERAARNFFRKGNLLALRELALRRTADRVDGQMQAYRREHSDAKVWPNRESLLACVGPGGNSDKVVRSAARLARQLDLDWHAVHVQTARAPTEGERQRVRRTLELAQSLGARTAQLSAPDVAVALVGYAREHNLARLVIGRQERAWRWPGRRSLAELLSALAEEMDVLQVALPSAQAPAPREAEPLKASLWSARSRRGYASALAAVALTTLIAEPLLRFIAPTNIAMVYLLNVVVVAWRFGRAAGALAALLAVAVFDFVFVEPRWTFAVGDAQYLVTFVVMLVVGLLTGQLAAGLQAQARAAQERERRVRGLYVMSRDLGAALVPEQVAEIGARFLRAEFGVASSVLTPPLLSAGGPEVLAVVPGGTAAPDLGVAQWAFDHSQPAGQGTATLPASPCLMLPLAAPMRLRGVLAVDGTGRRWTPEERELLDTCARLLAISLERIHYIEVAQASTLQIESERLRNSLLTAISHDLRTPLAALVGLADALQLAPPGLSAAQGDVADAIRRSAQRMSAQVTNLLDMARLQAGAVQLNRQWLPLQEVVGSALSALDELLAGRAVQVDLPPELPLLRLDAVLFERVLVNLLENALKYTPPGSPLSIAARVVGQGAGARVQIDLADRGPGFPAGREAQLFDKFERGDRESATPGVGLGLAICKAIVEAHDGEISAHNVASGGACVRIELPLGTPPL
ncbi:MAG: two-component system sensor histidine kinase KdbD [Roseateles depolymerans]|uniref:histidine kinase n=1 Tax=Roseateles depolymerans TaxID=76731 RepID=A0A2W5FFC3_9BURK|nr:MAG: two-component system sensor histidine kinase KdbD [Roseateles depolymerans]